MTRDALGAGVVKRSLAIAGHRTSVSLEDAFWRRLHQIAGARGVPLARIVAEVDAVRGEANLSSALRIFVLETLAPGDAPATQNDGRAAGTPIFG